MQQDDVIWGYINNHFCSYKAKTKTQTFCRNKYNVSGLCSRQSCPLANSQYATVRERDGVCYLYLKTIERAHSPLKMWERIKLKANYVQALGQVDKHMQYWSKWQIHKCKQRLTKIRQYLIRVRKLEKKTDADEMVHINKKVERREKVRERRAHIAADIDNAIKKELLDRLKRGLYDDIYGFEKSFKEALDEVEEEDEAESEVEEVEDDFVEDYSDDDMEDMDMQGNWGGPGGDDTGDYDLSDDDEGDYSGDSDDDGAGATGAPPGFSATSSSSSSTTTHPKSTKGKKSVTGKRKGTGELKSKPSKKPRKHVQILYEEETESLRE